ncbi:MAG: sensor histidine kinase, partial [Blastocatellia bacterium]
PAAGPLGYSNPVIGAIPGILVPPAFRLDLNDLQNGSTSRRPVGYTLVVVDLDYLKAVVFPRIAQRYLFNGQEVDYDFWIVSRADQSKTIFAGGALGGGAQQTGPVDAEVTIFGLRPDYITESGLDRFTASDGESGSGQVTVSGTGNGNGRDTVSGTGSGEVGTAGTGVVGAHLRNRPSRPPVRLITMEDGDLWKLVLRHKAGSLEAAVAGSKRWAVVLNLCVLLMLGACAVLIFVLGRRASLMANQQMRFVAGVSHELNTPLAVIRSAAQNLADGLIDNSEQMRQHGQLIDNQSRRLSEMIDQILSFGETYPQQNLTKAGQVSPVELLEKCLSTLGPLLSEKGVRVEKCVSHDIPLILGDENRLALALQNVLSNAIKYGGSAKWLRVDIASHIRKRRRFVLISVQDKGLGIRRSDLRDIFKPFYRGANVVASQIRGSGLGLTFVKEFVKAYGGDVVVESEENLGTTVTLIVPGLAVETFAEIPGKTPTGNLAFDEGRLNPLK